MKSSKASFAVITFTLASFFGNTLYAASTDDVQSALSDETHALSQLTSDPDHSAPYELLKAAQCIASIHIVKAGLIWGGRGGRGVVSCRKDDGTWSNPMFVDLASLSWGLQIGVEVVDLTLVFTNHNARQGFENGNFTLDASAGLAVGPQGRGLASGTNYKLDDMIYSYSKAQGLYIGVALQGSIVNPDSEFNTAVYGPLSAHEIFESPLATSPAVVLPFMLALNQFTQ
jgi:lipid-binding SYLF domain-containing protein